MLGFCNGFLGALHIPCRSWLASESDGSGEIDVGCQAFFAGKPAPTRELASCLGPAIDTAPCRSWLASESGGSGEIDVGCQDVFAGKPAPTRELASCLGLAIDTAPL
ncbi:hypothetical protein ELQ88_11500 [Pseudomonas sp. MPC6]|nr:hypothetical protein ELQ88_11500 [Pseudomonas sp. MPC6]